MLAEYLGLLVVFAIAACIVAGLLALQRALGPRREFVAKHEPFESGESQIVSARQRFALGHYLVVIVFVVLMAAIPLLFPWGVAFDRLGAQGFVAMLVFALPLALGFAYAWAKGAFEW